jgi:hypothetical protein
LEFVGLGLRDGSLVVVMVRDEFDMIVLDIIVPQAGNEKSVENDGLTNRDAEEQKLLKRGRVQKDIEKHLSSES